MHVVVLTNKMYSTGLISTFALISTWLIVVTAAMRYFVICHPFSAPRGSYTSHVRSYVAITLTCLFCVVSNIPSFFLFKSRTAFDKILNDTFVIIDLGPFNHRTSPGYAFHWMNKVMTIFVPGALLCFFNIRLLQALKESGRLRARHSSVSSVLPPSRHASSRNRLNVMLVAVIVMFVCFIYPVEFLDLFAHLTLDWSGIDREAVMLARMILNALQLSNFALNFILYCTLNGQFRSALTHWFCRRIIPPVLPTRRAVDNHLNDVILFNGCVGGVGKIAERINYKYVVAGVGRQQTQKLKVLTGSGSSSSRSPREVETVH